MPATLSPLVPLLVTVLATCAPPSHPIVTEVVYDAPGDDTGWEFVELWNPFAFDVPLAGVKLEAGDGAGAGRWTTRWTGAATDTIRARSRFVVGGVKVTPAPDAIATLDLQNGPDALRLAWPDGASETLGWGALAYPEYFCGAPAPDVAAGQSLSRVPDEADLGSNLLDFRAAEPSPGRANQPDANLALLAGTLALGPESPVPDEAVRVTLALANRGALARPALADTLVLGGDALAESLALALPALASGETLRVSEAAFAGSAGRRVLRAHVRAAGDLVAADDAESLAVRVGAGPLEVTEIQFHPANGEGEWIEVRNRTRTRLSLADFTLSDRADARAHVVDSLAVEPESLAVLAQDRAALLAAFADVDATRVAHVSAWPSLNNTNGDDGLADLVIVREGDGLLSDRVGYSASGVPAGATTEKYGTLWRASAASAGTPLAAPRAPASGDASLTVTPRRLALGSPETRLAWRLPWPQGRVSAVLYDMDGRRVASLLDDVASAAEGERSVRLDGAGAGVFAIVLRAHEGGAWVTRTALLRITGARP